MASKVMTNNVAANNVMAEMMSDAEIVAEFKQRGSWGLYTSVDLKGCDPASIRGPGEDPPVYHRTLRPD